MVESRALDVPAASTETANVTGMPAGTAHSGGGAACGVLDVSSRAAGGSVSAEARIDVTAIADTNDSGEFRAEKASTLDRSRASEDASTLDAFVLTLKSFSSYRQKPLPAASPSASTTKVTPFSPHKRLYGSQSSSGTAWFRRTWST
jgi:hypothetical protein